MTLKRESALESPRGLVPTPVVGSHAQGFRVTRPGVAPNSLRFRVTQMLLARGPQLQSCWPSRMKFLELRSNSSESSHGDLCAETLLSVYINQQQNPQHIGKPLDLGPPRFSWELCLHPQLPVRPRKGAGSPAAQLFHL